MHVWLGLAGALALGLVALGLSWDHQRRLASHVPILVFGALWVSVPVLGVWDARRKLRLGRREKPEIAD